MNEEMIRIIREKFNKSLGFGEICEIMRYGNYTLK